MYCLKVSHANSEPGRAAGLFRGGLRVVAILAIVAVGLTLLACSARTPQPETASPLLELESVLVTPFMDMSQIFGEDEQVRNSLSGKMFTTGAVADEAVAFMTENLLSLMGGIGNRAAIRLIGGEQARGISAKLMTPGRRELSERELLIQTARGLGADAILQGHLYEFVDRIGSSMSVTRPASVVFDIDLLSAKTGRLIWSAHYSESQQALSENLLKLGTFFKRGGRWITVEEMAKEGLEQILRPLEPKADQI